MELPFAEEYRIKMIEPIYKSTLEQRVQWIKEAKYNLFNLKSNQVFIDLLTDSGTGAMSDKQWSEMMLGDESYAGASSYYKMKNAIEEITGFPYFLPTHQGRAAENVLFSTLVKPGDIIPGNAHFDTTKGHIEFRKAKAVDCTIAEAYDNSVYHPFKGNLDINKLENVLKSASIDNIPFIIVTITCNTAGGQPVSMQNLKDVRILADMYKTKVIYDSARFAENAWFIKLREESYKDKSIREIVREMFSYADGMTMSSKKDAIVNIGGFVGLKDENIFKQATVYNILFEGFITYGGMAGRDMNALAQGLYEATTYEYLENRVGQVAFLGRKLKEYGIPVIEPFGGHAIFVNAFEFLPHIPKEEFPAQTLAIELYIEAGVRAVEIGTIMADRDPQIGENRYPKMDLVRLAVPRRTYSDNHMEYVAVAFKNVLDRRNEIKHGVKIIKEAPVLRHFTVELERS
jgi:tryptophanase